jgi:cell division protein FtsW (lipid II flippase)
MNNTQKLTLTLILFLTTIAVILTDPDVGSAFALVFAFPGFAVVWIAERWNA